MDKRNRIILLLDFSEYSENLISFTFEFSEIINAKVIFMHQIRGMAPAMADRDVRKEVIKAEINEAHSRLRKLAKGRIYSEESFLVSDMPILSMIKEIKSEAYFDWVIAGLKGTGAMKRLFMGSTTLSIIDDSDLLAVAVPARKPIAMSNRLMVGVSPKYPLNKSQFTVMLSAMKEQITQLEFFTVLKEEDDETKARDHLQKIQAEYKAFKPKVKLFKGEDALGLLHKRMQLIEGCFLVLQQGSRTLTDRLFRKFMINELVYRGQTPLIVLSK